MAKLKKTIRIKKRQERIINIVDIFSPIQKYLIRFLIELMKGSWFHYYFPIAVHKRTYEKQISSLYNNKFIKSDSKSNIERC